VANSATRAISRPPAQTTAASDRAASLPLRSERSHRLPQRFQDARQGSLSRFGSRERPLQRAEVGCKSLVPPEAVRASDRAPRGHQTHPRWLASRLEPTLRAVPTPVAVRLREERRTPPSAFVGCVRSG